MSGWIITCALIAALSAAIAWFVRGMERDLEGY